MRTTLKFFKIEQLDAKVAEYERRISTESLSLQEEKKLIAEKQALQAQKPLIRAYMEKQQGLDTIREEMKAVEVEFKVFGDELAKLREAEKREREALDKLKRKQQEQLQIPPGLFEELGSLKTTRDAVLAQIKALKVIRS